MCCRNKLKKLMLIVIAAGCFVTMGCATPQEEVREEKELVESTTDKPRLVTATVGNIEKAEYYVGEINPHMQVLQFPRRGTFLEYKVMLGDSVQAGQVVAVTKPECEQEIEDLKEQLDALRTDYRNQVTNYELRMATNRWQVGQHRSMIEAMSPDMRGFDDICISFELLMAEGGKIEVEKKQYMARTEKEITFLEGKLKRLEEKNESNVIVAPQDGIITYLADLKVGDEVGINSYPIVLADTTKYMIQCEDIPRTDMEDVKFVYGVKDGKKYDLQHRPYENGEYERKSAKGEGVYSIFEISDIDENISFGEDIMIVTVTESKENVLLLPSGCIHNDSGKDYVYRYVNGEREAVYVDIGMSDDRNTEILSGIQEGDRIYVSN